MVVPLGRKVRDSWKWDGKNCQEGHDQGTEKVKLGGRESNQMTNAVDL